MTYSLEEKEGEQNLAMPGEVDRTPYSENDRRAETAVEATGSATFKPCCPSYARTT